jgi:hypothetical protein
VLADIDNFKRRALEALCKRADPAFRLAKHGAATERSPIAVSAALATLS